MLYSRLRGEEALWFYILKINLVAFGFNYSKLCFPNRNSMECQDIDIYRNVWRGKGKAIKVWSQRCSQRHKAVGMLSAALFRSERTGPQGKKIKFSCPVVFCSNISLHLDICITCRKKRTFLTADFFNLAARARHWCAGNSYYPLHIAWGLAVL